MSLVQEKVASDASRLLYEDTLFCHLVEEVLLFEKELRSNHSYPAVLPGLLHLLLEDSVLQKWLTVEKKSKFSNKRVPAQLTVILASIVLCIFFIRILFVLFGENNKQLTSVLWQE